ncbi:MAG: CPBP family intramembrane metalloprotease, partial [Kiritimatiellae bacterium]|nr:CPBP family intramembrane metalloprotease [Kiritimatiellia bacterium]
WAAVVFAIVHLDVMHLSVAGVVDVVSIGFMGLLFIFVVLETGSLLPAIIFHYVHDIFVYLVQNTPGASEPLQSVLLYAFLWTGLAAGAWLTRRIVSRGRARAPIPA